MISDGKTPAQFYARAGMMAIVSLVMWASVFAAFSWLGLALAVGSMASIPFYIEDGNRRKPKK